MSKKKKILMSPLRKLNREPGSAVIKSFNNKLRIRLNKIERTILQRSIIVMSFSFDRCRFERKQPPSFLRMKSERV